MIEPSADDRVLWEVAGLRTGEDLSNLFGAPGLGVPVGLRLEEDERGSILHYHAFPYRPVKAEPAMFEHFIALGQAAASPQDVLAYAQRWGVLEVCEHLVPASHHSNCRPIGAPRLERSEPVWSWLMLAQQARAMLSLAANLKLGEPGRSDAWEIAYMWAPRKAPWWPREQPSDAELKLSREEYRRALIDYERHLLACRVNEWLALGGVIPRFNWGQRGASIRLGASLFGVLAVQLLSAISGTSPITFCSGCGSPYFPSRGPKAGQRHYCLSCQKAKVPGRDAQRDYEKRERQRMADPM